MNPFASLRGRLAVGAAAVALISVAAAGIGIVWQLDRQDRAETDKELRARAAHIMAGDKMSEEAQEDAADGREDTYRVLLDGSGSIVRLIEYGAVIAERGDEQGAQIPVPTARGMSDVIVGGTTWRSFVIPVDAETTLQVLESLAPVDERLARNVQTVGLVTAAVTVFAAIIGWVVAAGILRPLDRLRSAAQGVRGDLDAHPLPRSDRPSEVGELTDTLNEMISRLQNSTAVARRFTADAGHELRTPLTSMGAYIETLRREPEPAASRRQEITTELAAEHQRLVSLLSGLQQLARVDAAVLPAREEIDIVELLDGSVRRARVRHPDVSFALTQDARDAPLLDGWPDGIRVLVNNLLDNAALHGRPGGQVVVTTRLGEGMLRVRVEDDGPGIPAADRDRMWERFARGAHARSSGSGLGLALVAHQVALHGGTVSLGRSEEWGGLSVEVRLPVASDARAEDGGRDRSGAR